MEKPARFESSITFLRTRDLAATSDFYERIIGLRLILDQGGCRVYEVARGGYLGFCEKEETEIQKDLVFTFVTQDVDGWYERLRGEGVAFEKTPAHNPTYKIYHCFFRDPNGYLLEIQRFEDPRWDDR